MVEHSLGKGEVSSSNLDKSSRLQFSRLSTKFLKSRLISLLFKYLVSDFFRRCVDTELFIPVFDVNEEDEHG